jgi:hypothetical protein
MLEKTVYLSALYLSGDKTALVFQVLAVVLAGLLVGMIGWFSRPGRSILLAMLQAPIYWGLSELSAGEWSYFFYRVLSPLIQSLGGQIYSNRLADMAVVYGLPGLAMGMVSAAACLWAWSALKKKGRAGR